MLWRIGALVAFVGVFSSLQATRAERYEKYVERLDERVAEYAPIIAAWKAKLTHPFTGIAGYADLPGPTKSLFTRAGIRSAEHKICLGELLVLMNSNDGDGFKAQADWIAFFQQAGTVGQLRQSVQAALDVVTVVLAKHFPKFTPLIPFFQTIKPQLEALLIRIEHFDDEQPAAVVDQGYDDAYDGGFDQGGYDDVYDGAFNRGGYDDAYDNRIDPTIAPLQPTALQSLLAHVASLAQNYKRSLALVATLGVLAVAAAANNA